MRYYAVADVHGFYSQFHTSLEAAGYFRDTGPHRLVLLGDCFDRGPEAVKMQEFLLDRLAKDEVTLIRGNHEDLFTELVTVDEGLPVRHHKSNGTYGTALQLTDFDPGTALIRHRELAEKARETPYFREIIPAAIDYLETESYIFVHGWIPCIKAMDGSLLYKPDWREASAEEWYEARWINGMDAVLRCREEKTILCGHWHCSYGHAVYEKNGSEFGEDANFSPYRAKGILALDACTALSGRVNVEVIEEC